MGRLEAVRGVSKDLEFMEQLLATLKKSKVRGGGAGGLGSDDDEVTYRLFVRLCDLLGVGPSGARAIWQNMPARKGLCLIAKICKYCEQ